MRVIEQNLYFCRTHFDGYFSSSYLELKTEMELKLLPSFLTHLTTYWLSCFIWALARTILSKFEGLEYYKCLSSSSLCHTMLSYPILYHTVLYCTIFGIKAHACGKSMLQSEIKQIYYQRSDDSLLSTHMIDVF